MDVPWDNNAPLLFTTLATRHSSSTLEVSWMITSTMTTRVNAWPVGIHRIQLVVELFKLASIICLLELVQTSIISMVNAILMLKWMTSSLKLK